MAKKIDSIFKKETKPEVQVALRLSPELHKYLHELSASHDQSINKILLKMIEYFKSKEGK